MSPATPMRRRIAGAAAASLCLIGLTGITSSTAVTAGPYNIDGTVPDVGATLVADLSGSAQELGPANSNTTKLGVIHTAPVPMLATTNPNAQVDLRNIWLDSDLFGGDTWVYLGWERDSNKGSGVIMYEFQQAELAADCDYSGTTPSLIANCNPFELRQPGDFIIVWDQSGNNANIILRTWGFTDKDGDTIWDVGEPLVLSAGVSLTDTGDAVARYSTDRFRGEAAVNLSEAVFPDVPTSCLNIANIIPGTVTGNSDTADYKDVVLKDISDILNISNCGSVKITKDTNPEGGTGEFDYTLSRTGGATIRFNGDTEATGTLTEDGDFETQVNLKAGTGYTLSEDIVSGAYDLLSIDCGGVDVDAGNTFTVVAGVMTECLITNELQQGTLTVNKIVTNNSGGTLTAADFHFSVDGGTAVAFEADGSNSMTVDAGTYVVTETDANSRGYATTYGASCAAVIVPAGGTGSCTITNDDQPGTLIVNKVLINDNGGTAGVTGLLLQGQRRLRPCRSRRTPATASPSPRGPTPSWRTQRPATRRPTTTAPASSSPTVGVRPAPSPTTTRRPR